MGGWQACHREMRSTYFRGSIDEAHTFLKERLAAVLTANPWLCAHLVKRDEMHGVAMTWSDEGLAEALSALETNTSAILHLAPADLKDKLGLENPYKDLCRALTRSKLAVPVGKRCLKEGRPLLSLCLIPTGASEFTVWLSMSISSPMATPPMRFSICFFVKMTPR